ncbi:MAG: metal-sulfur cluster assembly factor [Candidatus Dormibacteraeota bacterium]|nr:metal-sulfur cluster assembly factor [Candidatus Dormibacteraeota bacterium]MBO0704342.1 metal-sulfur cluster assembly factor [Candidatus Dormibacteraeota bacterium]MBO0761624.1 metal-sulfur cluster assembly factor [Candidatus Dormibacteraeota bacterium]
MTSAERLREALRDVEDPEMPVNIVDLGMIYGIREQGGTVTVDLTFTAMGCPASDLIVDDIRARLLQEDGVRDVEVNVVWDPPWSAARLTPEGRDTLEMWGLAV